MTPFLVEVEAVKVHAYGGLIYDVGEKYDAIVNEADKLVARGLVTPTGRTVTKQEILDGYVSPASGRTEPLGPPLIAD